MVKIFINPITAAKFQVVGTSKKDIVAALTKHIHPDNLLEKYGGNMKEERIKGRPMSLQTSAAPSHYCRGELVAADDLNDEKYDKLFYMQPSGQGATGVMDGLPIPPSKSLPAQES